MGRCRPAVVREGAERDREGRDGETTGRATPRRIGDVRHTRAESRAAAVPAVLIDGYQRVANLRRRGESVVDPVARRGLVGLISGGNIQIFK